MNDPNNMFFFFKFNLFLLGIRYNSVYFVALQQNRYCASTQTRVKIMNIVVNARL